MALFVHVDEMGKENTATHNENLSMFLFLYSLLSLFHHRQCKQRHPGKIANTQTHCASATDRNKWSKQLEKDKKKMTFENIYTLCHRSIWFYLSIYTLLCLRSIWSPISRSDTKFSFCNGMQSVWRHAYIRVCTKCAHYWTEIIMQTFVMCNIK